MRNNLTEGKTRKFAVFAKIAIFYARALYKDACIRIIYKEKQETDLSPFEDTPNKLHPKSSSLTPQKV